MRRSSLWALVVLAGCGGERVGSAPTSGPPPSPSIEADAQPAATPLRADDAESDHPYSRELIRNLFTVWQVPAADLKGEVIACVKLARDGSIADRRLARRASNEIDRSVEKALHDVPAMGKPVPAELVPVLVEKGICVRFAVTD